MAPLTTSPIGVFLFSSAAAGTAGIAAYLRGGKPVTILSIVTAGLNSGLLGLAISLLWYQKFQDNIYSLVGICVVAGLTGAAGLDFLLTAIQKGGFSINIGGGKDDKGNSKMDFGLTQEGKPTDDKN
jgi:hypothetical protein